MPHISGVASSSKVSKFSDDFNRTTSSELTGTGKPWLSINGTWTANGTVATSSTAASSYPYAVRPNSLDLTQSATVSNGTGLIFWSNSGSNWYSTVSYNVSTSSSYSCNPYNCNPYSCNCVSCNPYNCNPYPCNCTTSYSCGTEFGVYQIGNECCNAMNPDLPCYPATATQTCSSTCYSTCYQTCCDTCYQTCYQTCSTTSNSYYLRLLKSVSGTVSTATADVSLASAAVAILTTVSGDTITSKAYSDAEMTTQLGTTLTHTASSPSKGYYVGIIKTPSDNQGSTIDNYNLTTQ
jgi:hypothetical protein